jgi:hypothetical protein
MGLLGGSIAQIVAKFHPDSPRKVVASVRADVDTPEMPVADPAPGHSLERAKYPCNGPCHWAGAASGRASLMRPLRDAVHHSDEGDERFGVGRVERRRTGESTKAARGYGTLNNATGRRIGNEDEAGEE